MKYIKEWNIFKNSKKDGDDIVNKVIDIAEKENLPISGNDPYIIKISGGGNYILFNDPSYPFIRRSDKDFYISKSLMKGVMKRIKKLITQQDKLEKERELEKLSDLGRETTKYNL